MSSRSIMALSCLLLAACSSQPKPHLESAPMPQDVPPEHHSQTQTVEREPLPIDTVYDIFLADLASFRQDHFIAAETLLKQAIELKNEDLFGEAAWHASQVDDELLKLVLSEWSNEFATSQRLYSFLAFFFLQRQQPLRALDIALEITDQEELNPLTHNISIALMGLDDPTQRNEATEKIDTIARNFPEAYGPAIAQAMIRWQSSPEEALTRLAQANEKYSDNLNVFSAYIGLLAEDSQFEKARSLLLMSGKTDSDLYLATQLAKLDYMIGGATQQFITIIDSDVLQVDSQWINDTTRWLLKHRLFDITEIYLDKLKTYRFAHSSYWRLMAEQAQLQGNQEKVIDYLLNITRGSDLDNTARFLNQALMSDTEDSRLIQWYDRVRTDNPSQRDHWFLVEALAVSERLAPNTAEGRLSHLSNQAKHVFEVSALSYEQLNTSGKTLEADAALERFIANNPNHAEAMNTLAYGWVLRGERLSQALEMLGAALAIQPNNAMILDSYAWALYKLERLDEALEYIQRAKDLSDHPEIQEHLVIIRRAISERPPYSAGVN